MKPLASYQAAFKADPAMVLLMQTLEGTETRVPLHSFKFTRDNNLTLKQTIKSLIRKLFILGVVQQGQFGKC